MHVASLGFAAASCDLEHVMDAELIPLCAGSLGAILPASEDRDERSHVCEGVLEAGDQTKPEEEEGVDGNTSDFGTS